MGEDRESLDIPIRDEHGRESDEFIQIYLDEDPMRMVQFYPQ